VPIWKQQRFASGELAWVGLPDESQPAGASARAGAAVS
jgi:hypothetical protein